MIEYGGPASIQLEVWNVDKIDGSSTRRVRHNGTGYFYSATIDIAGTMSSVTGGDITPPSKVSGLAVTTVSDSQLKLAWAVNPEPDLAHYNVYSGTTAGFVVNTGTDSPSAVPNSNSYSNTGLSSSTTYYYKVAAVDTSGNIGILSNEASAATYAAGIFYSVAIASNAAASLYSGVSVRYGEEAANASSVIVGKSLKAWKVRLRKSATPSGNITAKIRRKSDDSVVATFDQTIDSTTLPPVFAEYIFTLTNPYTIQSGDRIMIEYGGPASIQLEVWNVDKIDGSSTRRVRHNGTGYFYSATIDIAGTMSYI